MSIIKILSTEFEVFSKKNHFSFNQIEKFPPLTITSTLYPLFNAPLIFNFFLVQKFD